MVPLELDLNDIEMFKSEIRKWESWESRQSECALCLPYVHTMDYVNISDS